MGFGGVGFRGLGSGLQAFGFHALGRPVPISGELVLYLVLVQGARLEVQHSSSLE